MSTGSIPTQLSMLTKLERIGLYSNHLTGQCFSLTYIVQIIVTFWTESSHSRLGRGNPHFFGLFAHYVDFVANTGTIPTQLSLLTDLIAFSVGNNSMVGCIPSYVCENKECRTWRAGKYLDGTSSADQECGTLPACGINETCARWRYVRAACALLTCLLRMWVCPKSNEIKHL